MISIQKEIKNEVEYFKDYSLGESIVQDLLMEQVVTMMEYFGGMLRKKK